MTRQERKEARLLEQGPADLRYPGRALHVGRYKGWLRFCHAIYLRDAAYLRRRGDFGPARAVLAQARRERVAEWPKRRH